MFSTPEQISAATKSAYELQLALMTSLTQKALEGVEKLVELNLTVARTSMDESSFAVKQLLAAKDPQEFFAMSKAQSQPQAEKAVSYARHVASIASEVQAEFAKVAEAQISEVNQKVAKLVEDVAKNAPAGSESVIAMFKSAMGNANAGYEQMSRTAKQAAATIEGNVTSAVSQLSEASAKATRGASKK
ncbi:phasin family protein [Actimicrobium sp. GrIS 1.19]|uniref:TIGR01841 family phasin n=1 Tax=Actimicrobium sp. GrIS 1.19 TaxID=3071708 RepID=UPI002E0BCC89|nr:TIGR01841 family phasin [Actimicrobium sp. GrIS 1.19]MEC5215439.1 phasin family protein [Actimicrobium sp. GrIS 1.19]